MSDRPKTVTIIKEDTRAYGLRILDQDGRDLTKDLQIRKVTWSMEAGLPPVVTLEVLPARINAQGRLEVLPSSIVADELDAVPRMGAETDEPEGARYLMMSDTLARQIAAALRMPKP